MTTRLRVAKRGRATDARKLPEVGTHAIVYDVAPVCESDPHDPNHWMQKVRVTLDRRGFKVGVGGGAGHWHCVAAVAWGDVEEFASRQLREDTERLRESFRLADRDNLCIASVVDPYTRTAIDMARWFYEAQDRDGRTLWREAPANVRADYVRRMRSLLDAGIVGPMVATDDEEESDDD